MYPHEDVARATVVTELAHRGVTAAELARDTGLDPGTVRDFLNGARWPRMRSLGKIEKYLGWEPGGIMNAARGLPGAKVPPRSVGGSRDADSEGVYLAIDASSLEGLSEDERDEVLTAAKLTVLSTARAIKRSRE